MDLFEQDSDVNVYIYNQRWLEKIKFDDYYLDEYRKEKVCFRMDIYPNKSNDKIVLEYKKRVILYSNYINDNIVFNDIQEAKEYLDKYQYEALGRWFDIQIFRNWPKGQKSKL